MTDVEILNPHFPEGPFRAAIFDFDGTISLLRRDWQSVMCRMMVAALQDTGTSEPADELQAVADEIIYSLTGQPTIVQMQALAEQVRQRADASREPLDYLAEYQEVLMGQARGRIEAVRSGSVHRRDVMVAGAEQFMERICRAGSLLYLLSGTDVAHVQSEVEVLGLDASFCGRVFGPVNNDPAFSKLAVMQQVLAEHRLRGEEIMAIGDGATEIRAVKSLGGLAIGVASNEVTLQGIDARKRDSLVRAGADIIIPDYQHADDLLQLIRFAPMSRP